MVEIKPTTYRQEAFRKFNHAGVALEKAKLMRDVSLDPEEALAYNTEVRAIGHARFGQWLAINRPDALK